MFKRWIMIFWGFFLDNYSEMKMMNYTVSLEDTELVKSDFLALSETTKYGSSENDNHELPPARSGLMCVVISRIAVLVLFALILVGVILLRVRISSFFTNYL